MLHPVLLLSYDVCKFLYMSTGGSSSSRHFEKVNHCYDFEWQHRCPTCDLPFSSELAVKIHLGRDHKPDKAQDFRYRLADKAVQKKKLELQQADRPAIINNGSVLENVFNFIYLGSVFAANGLHEYDIMRRIAMAMTRYGRLRHIFDSEFASLDLKLRLYRAAICSILSFGCETWALDAKTRRKLNGANSAMLARFTGKTQQQEARPATTSFNLVRQMRITRYKYLGTILRQGSNQEVGGQNRLIFRAAIVQYESTMDGSLLMDAPAHFSFNNLIDQARDKAGWNAHIANIPF